MSGPVPSPSMNGTMGWSGTCRWPSLSVMGVPSGGTEGVHGVGIGCADLSGFIRVGEGPPGERGNPGTPLAAIPRQGQEVVVRRVVGARAHVAHEAALGGLQEGPEVVLGADLGAAAHPAVQILAADAVAVAQAEV